jgi:DNA repair protein RecO (recombination protein O)
MRAEPLEAFVLHRWAYSESSLVLDVFTRARGRLAVLAKGAKRPYSQLKAVLLPFQRVHLQLGKAPKDPAQEVQLLRSAEWAGGQAALLGGEALFAGFHCNELLLKGLARQDAHPRLFDHYAAVLQALALAEDEAGRQALLRSLEVLLLQEAGWLPSLTEETASGRPVRADAHYRLSPEAGLVAVPPGGVHEACSGAALSDMQRALGSHVAKPGAAAQALAALAAAQPAHEAWARQLQQVLAYHLGDRSLRSLALLRDLKLTLEWR